MIQILKSKLYKPVLLLIFILIFGVAGYMILFGDTFLNSLYMTVITMTPFGFSEIHPLSSEEKVFTIF